jgi:hypothetical protein
MVRAAVSAMLLATADAMPSCNQVDGDYPGCGISKMTHASTQPRAGKAFIEKYFNVQTPGDECDGDVCDCSSQGAPDIEQGRVYTTRQISPSGGAPPGNGFGLHLVSVPGHKTTGGLTVDEVESHFSEKLGDMSKFDSFMDFNVVFATSSLQAYKTAFDKDGVNYLLGTWSASNGDAYTSVIVQVPGSQLLLELVQKTSLTSETAVRFEQRVPDDVLSAQEERLTGAAVEDTTSDYIVSLVVNRAASETALGKLDDFYVTGMGTTKTHDESANGVSKKCYLWPGASVNVCFTARPDSATSTDFKVSDFEDMLNNVHKTIIGDHPLCELDRWFDNHYAIDSQSVSNTQILAYINSKKPYHHCSSGFFSSGLSSVYDPTGLGIQMDTQTGAPNDCSSSEFHELMTSVTGPGNPACTVSTSGCPSLSSEVTV